MTDQDGKSMYSASSLASSTKNFDFKGAVISPINQIVIQMSILPTASAVIDGICELIILQQAYYYCGYQSIIPLIIGKIITRAVQFLTSASSVGLIPTVQQRLLCEQSLAASLIFAHSLIVNLSIGLVLNILLGVFASQIQDKAASTFNTGNYLKLVLQATPVFQAISQSPLVFLDAENNGNTLALIKISRSLLHLVVLCTTIQIFESNGMKITLDYFAYIEIAFSALFTIVTLYITIDGTKNPEEQITRFLLNKGSFKMLKAGVFGIVVEKMLQQVVYQAPEQLNWLFSLACVYRETTSADQISVFMAFALYVTFEPLCTSIATTMRTTFIQILTPNNQMKRYERVTSVVLEGFLIQFSINAIFNVILMCSIKTIITALYYDAIYDQEGFQFTNSLYDTTRFPKVMYVTVEGLLRPMYDFVFTTCLVTLMKDVVYFLVALRYVAVVAAFILTFCLSTQDVLDQLFFPHLSADLAAIAMYLLVIIRNFRKRQQLQEFEKDVVKDDGEQKIEISEMNKLNVLDDKVATTTDETDKQQPHTLEMEEFKMVPMPDTSILKVSGKVVQMFDKSEKHSFIGENSTSKGNEQKVFQLQPPFLTSKNNASGDQESGNKASDKRLEDQIAIVQNPDARVE